MSLAAAGLPSSSNRLDMNDRQSRLIRAAQEALLFVQVLKPCPWRVSEAAKRLSEALEAAREAGHEQLAARDHQQGPGESLNRAKTILLRKHLDPIAADGLEMFAGLPGIEESLKLPRIKARPAMHLEAAQRVRRVAEKHEQEFITERNYSENFLELFDAAVRDLEQATHVEQGAYRADYTLATQKVKEEIARLRRAFDVLDTRITEAYLDVDSIRHRWRQASQIQQRIGRPRKTRPRRNRRDGKLPLLPPNPPPQDEAEADT
jgi:hypothetical protein